MWRVRLRVWAFFGTDLSVDKPIVRANVS